MIVWISGPTGAGKSTLAQIFGRFRFSVVEESLPPNTFKAFASDPVRNCAQLQEQIMRSRLKSWQGLSSSAQVAFDRSVDEDAHVFCRMHHELGFLNRQQYERLLDLARLLQTMMPKPDLIMFMSPKREVLAKRVRQPIHPAVIVDGLDRQVTLYDEWIATRDEEIIRLDNSACRLQTVQQLFSENRQC